MENIYKIKIRSNPDPRGLYPSERRYSASTVLGLGVVHLALAATALLLASLSLTSNKHQLNPLIGVKDDAAVLNNNSEKLGFDVNARSFEDGLEEEGLFSVGNPSTESDNLDVASEFFDGFTTESVRSKRSSEDEEVDEDGFYRNFNPYTNLSLAPCVMSLGALAAGLSGLLAWKRWYIDHNIRWFFVMSIVSTLTSVSCVIITTIAIINLHEYSYSRNGEEPQLELSDGDNSLKLLNEHYLKILRENNLTTPGERGYFDFNQKKPNVRFILALNILISCVLEVMWSVLSARIGFRGMRNAYPDDIVISRNQGKIEVNTVHKGNRKNRIAPPDILNHFPDAGKLAKYFPRIDSGGNLPKAESNAEYQERVRQFLSSNNTDDSSSK